MSAIRAVWYIIVYGVSALALMALVDWRLALPTALWFAAYFFFLRHFVPKLRDLAKASSEVRSALMGRIVDSYTNILTVKLFARLANEDAYVREAVDDHQVAVGAHMRVITLFMFWLSAMNALLLTSTAAIGITLWAQGAVSAGVVATALPLAWQIANVAGWVSWEVTGIFENIGVVQEGMQTIEMDLARLVSSGMITFETAAEASQYPKEILAQAATMRSQLQAQATMAAGQAATTGAGTLART